MPLDLKIIHNVLLILEVFFAQLTGVYKLDSKTAMQSEFHRSGMVILNSAEVQKFLTALTITLTSPYSTKFLNDDIADRFDELNGIQGARSSKFKGISPSLNMSEQGLLKYSIGQRFSISGRLQTHPVYYPGPVSGYHGIDLDKVKLDDLRARSPFEEQFDTAIDFVKSKMEPKNPHLINEPLQPCELYKELGVYIETTFASNKIELPNVDYTTLTEEERRRFEMIKKQLEN